MSHSFSLLLKTLLVNYVQVFLSIASNTVVPSQLITANLVLFGLFRGFRRSISKDGLVAIVWTVFVPSPELPWYLARYQGSSQEGTESHYWATTSSFWLHLHRAAYVTTNYHIPTPDPRLVMKHANAQDMDYGLSISSFSRVGQGCSFRSAHDIQRHTLRLVRGLQYQPWMGMCFFLGCAPRC